MTWSEIIKKIENIVNINKKQNILPVKLLYKNIIYSKDDEIANAFNTFFTNIGNTIEDKILQVETNFISYLKTPTPNSIFLKPISDAEVVDIIKDLNISKACGPFSIPTNILKYYSELLCKPLAILINKFFSEGIFPNLLKFADVCPIFKKVTKINVKIIDQFLFFQTLVSSSNGLCTPVFTIFSKSITFSINVNLVSVKIILLIMLS